MAMTSPVGGTTSLPQYLQQRKPAAGVPENAREQQAAKTQPTVTPPNSGSPQAPAAAAPSPHPVSTTGNPTIPPAPPSPAMMGGAQIAGAPTAAGQAPAGLGGNLSSMLEKLKAMQGQKPAPAATAIPVSGGLVNSTAQQGGLTSPAAQPQYGGKVPQPAAAPAPAPAPAAAPAPNMDPAATPPAAAVPPPIATGDTGQTQPGGPIGLDRLRQVLEQALGGNGRYSDDLVSRLREQSQHTLEDTRRSEEDRLKADAASRGMFHSTGLSTSLGDASQRYVRGIADSETSLLGRIADANAQDKQTAIGNVFQFGQGEQENQRLQAYIAALLAEQGSAGGPTIPGATAAYGDLPQPGTADYSSIYNQLGQILTPKPAATTPGATK